MTIPSIRVHFVPPPKAHESASSYVFQVVEIGGQEEHDDYETEDTRGLKVLAEEVFGSDGVEGGG